MGNILDYLQWRGDLSFTADPFNEVDNLIFSELYYVDFEGVLDQDDAPRSLTVREASERYFALHSPQETEEKAFFIKAASYLMKQMAQTERFGGLKISGYVNLLAPSRDEQMAALTVLLPDGTACVAFRGTDNTIVGWKEDFQLAYLKQTSGQQHAAGYLNRIGRALNRPLRVVGHSKGGNLAVYATVLCDEDVRPMVREIYCNDGPGFLQEIVDTDSYRTAAAITRSFVPEESLFGLLMNGMLQHRIIKSSAKGIYQHDAMSWQVEGNHFVAGEGLSQSSQMVSRTLAEWNSGMKEEQRRDFVETVFDVLASSGKDTFAEIHSDKLKNYGEIAKAVMGLDKPRRDSLMDALGALARTGRGALVGELTKLLQ